MYSKKRRSDVMRYCGILLHPTSLPGKYGIGDLGQAAYDFVDFLEKAGQSMWQILPLGHTGFGDSPYQSFSAFAGNPLMISPDLLVEGGLLKSEDIAKVPEFDEAKVDFGKVQSYKEGLLKKAYTNFKKGKADKEFTAFCRKNSFWLKDYALFMALKNYFIEQRRNEYESPEYKAYYKLTVKSLGENGVKDCYYGACWNSFPEKLKNRDEAELKKYTNSLKKEVEYYKFIQYLFFKQWDELKKYANEKGIKLIGDIPIFVAADSADTWAQRELFHINAKGFPTEVAGVPPDYFSEEGQLWGNPLYNWKIHAQTGYEWWVKRVDSVLKLVDIVRIDHFRAFESYWSIPYGSKNAVKGEWKKGPGRELFDAISDKLGSLDIIAEDLGDLNEEVHILRDELGLPGMKILQFAFDNSGNEYQPHNYTSDNFVVYTGTHDNDTTIGWYKNTNESCRDYARRLMRVSGDDISWDMIRLAISSNARYCIIPLQDVLCLDSDARMNTPGVADGNWQFRFKADALTDEKAEGLKYLCELYNRQ
jgi:4-alpha-glucanotransferase